MKKIFNIKTYLVFVVIYVVLMFLGFYYDLNISEALYDGTSTFGYIMAQAGILPSVVVASIGGVLILLGDDKKNKTFRGIRIFFCTGCCLFAYYYTIDEISDIYAKIIGVIIVTISIVLTQKFCKNKNKETLTRVGLWLMFMVASEVVFINFFLKFIFPRPRYRFVITYGKDLYRRVFNPDAELKAMYVAKGVLSEEFKSFPSGHASSTGCLLGFLSLCYLNDNYKNKAWLIFILAIVGICLVSMGRIILGAHFLSDVATGTFITITTWMLWHKVFMECFKGKKEK